MLSVGLDWLLAVAMLLMLETALGRKIVCFCLCCIMRHTVIAQCLMITNEGHLHLQMCKQQASIWTLLRLKVHLTPSTFFLSKGALKSALEGHSGLSAWCLHAFSRFQSCVETCVHNVNEAYLSAIWQVGFSSLDKSSNHHKTDVCSVLSRQQFEKAKSIMCIRRQTPRPGSSRMEPLHWVCVCVCNL